MYGYTCTVIRYGDNWIAYARCNENPADSAWVLYDSEEAAQAQVDEWIETLERQAVAV